MSVEVIIVEELLLIASNLILKFIQADSSIANRYYQSNTTD